MTTGESAAEILETAAEHVERYGHVRGQWGGPGGPCCVVGALHAVSLPPRRYSGEARLLARATLELAIGGDPFEWNDSRGNQSLAAAALRRAARLLR